MLIRIVRLTIAPDRLQDFLSLFDRVAPSIRAMKGCQRLELLQDLTYPNIFATYSLWREEADLDAYRKTDFFEQTWQETRALFAAPPSAFSYRVFEYPSAIAP